MVAAKKLYPHAELVFPGSQERKLRDFLDVFNPVEIKRLKEIDFSKVAKLIIVDTKKPGRIGPLAKLLSKRDLKVHIYDHHPLVKGDIRGELEKIEDVGATATIFTELLKNKKLSPTPMEATILSLGIYEETGRLLFPSTTERDLLAVSYLLRKGANLNIVSNFLKVEFGAEELDLLNELVKSSREIVLCGIKIMIAKAYRETYVGDAAHLVHRIMDMEDIDAGILILGMEDKILLVARSRVAELNVAGLLEEFGGGGHPNAASATIKEASIEVVADRITGLLPGHVKPVKVASDIMTSPVITMQWDSTIKEAEDILTKYGVNVLPVRKDERYFGLISRETVEKALFHGFKNHRCMEFTTTDAITVGPDTPARDIETIMIEQNQRFMPVIKNGQITGAITRTDLLRVLYEEFLRRRHIDKEGITEKPVVGRNLVSWIKERFPREIFELLRVSGELADSMGFSAYLVGGTVRDMLLGQENLDIDIVIEGDGIFFAEALSERLKASVRYHRSFGTARIVKDGLRVDIATARTEYYESPAALPTVETSSIKKDLYRRDFTINALAIKLNPKDFGLLIDFFGGQRDIKEKTIRVLHNLSCIEDPTRAFRAVRFSERFGFKISKHTENLIKSAIKLNLFEKLSGSRLCEELFIAFRETNPVRTLKRLSDLGLLQVINQKLVFDKKLEATLVSMNETLAWYNLLYMEEKADMGVLYLMALLSRLNDDDRKGALERLLTPPSIKELVLNGMSKSAGILGKLPVKNPVRLYHLLENTKIEIILFSMAATKDANRKKEISQFLLELRKIKPVLTGEDLKKMGFTPGPVYSEILRKLLDAKLSGKLRTVDDEIKFVRSHYQPEGDNPKLAAKEDLP